MHSFCRALPTRLQSLIGVFARIIRQRVGLRMMVNGYMIVMMKMMKMTVMTMMEQLFKKADGQQRPCPDIHSAAALVVQSYFCLERICNFGFGKYLNNILYKCTF